MRPSPPIDPIIVEHARRMGDPEHGMVYGVIQEVFRRSAAVALEAGAPALADATRECARRGAINGDSAIEARGVSLFAPQTERTDQLFLVMRTTYSQYLLCLQLTDAAQAKIDRTLGNVLRTQDQAYEMAAGDAERRAGATTIGAVSLGLTSSLEEAMESWRERGAMHEVISKSADAPVSTHQGQRWVRGEAGHPDLDHWTSAWGALNAALEELGGRQSVTLALAGLAQRQYQAAAKPRFYSHEQQQRIQAAAELGEWIARLDDGLPAAKASSALRALERFELETSFRFAWARLARAESRCIAVGVTGYERAIEFDYDRLAWLPRSPSTVRVVMSDEQSCFAVLTRDNGAVSVHGGSLPGRRGAEIWLPKLIANPNHDLLAQFTPSDDGWSLDAADDRPIHPNPHWRDFLSSGAAFAQAVEMRHPEPAPVNYRLELI